MSNLSVRWAFNFGSWKPSQAEILLATSCIPADEKQRIAKFVFKKDFKASLIGCLMIRKFLASVTNIPYNVIKIQRDDKNKPFCAEAGRISFNVSHHGNFTVLSGEVDGTQVGVDVMQIGYSGGKTLNEFFRIMNRQFASSEWSAIRNSGSESQQLTTFCRNWSLKESYVKAIGVGITINLQDIVFQMNTNNLDIGKIATDTELYVCGSKEPWCFEETLLDEKHCVATALFNTNGLNNHTPANFTVLSFDDLMNGAIPLINSDLEYCNNFFKKDN